MEVMKVGRVVKERLFKCTADPSPFRQRARQLFDDVNKCKEVSSDFNFLAGTSSCGSVTSVKQKFFFFNL